jgi:hypothetical protein
MITLLQTQGQMFTDADKLIFSIVWGVLSIISANILLHVWKYEGKLTLLSYLGAAAFGTLMAPVISTLALLGWLGTITPKDAKGWITKSVERVKEATIGHWRDLFGEPKGRKLIAKQAPPGGGGPTIGYGSNQIYVHPNPPSVHIQTVGPFLNDMMNVPTHKTSSLVSAPPPPGPHPNFARGTRNPSSGPNRMTRLSNGSGAPSWYVPPPAVKAKKAAPKS